MKWIKAEKRDFFQDDGYDVTFEELLADKEQGEEYIKQAYPVKDADLLQIIQEAFAGRDVKIEGPKRSPNAGSLNGIHAWAAYWVMDISVIINDSGKGTMTPRGDYWEVSKSFLRFHFRSEWKPESLPQFSVNASDSTQGLKIYNGANVDSEHDVKAYVESILGDYPVNEAKDFIY